MTIRLAAVLLAGVAACFVGGCLAVWGDRRFRLLVFWAVVVVVAVVGGGLWDGL